MATGAGRGREAPAAVPAPPTPRSVVVLVPAFAPATAVEHPGRAVPEDTADGRDGERDHAGRRGQHGVVQDDRLEEQQEREESPAEPASSPFTDPISPMTTYMTAGSRVNSADRAIHPGLPSPRLV